MNRYGQRTSAAAVLAHSDEGHLLGREVEAELAGELLPGRFEDVARGVVHRAALRATQVQVARGEVAGQVVRRPCASEVDVRDEPELAERVERPVHGRAVDPRAQLLGPLADLLRAQVLLGPRQHLDHREPGGRDPLAPLTQPLRADFNRARHPRSLRTSSPSSSARWSSWPLPSWPPSSSWRSSWPSSSWPSSSWPPSSWPSSSWPSSSWRSSSSPWTSSRSSSPGRGLACRPAARPRGAARSSRPRRPCGASRSSPRR